jgi:DNA-binding winged helix-turn-helix (wHTH) protein
VQSPPVSPNAIRFGLFEADLSAGELRKRGRKIPLQDQPFRVLTLLLARPGELVSREEFQRALWPGDTFVEFDEGLNKAIQKLRQALDDSSDNPRFIETLPRKGYRFIAPVDCNAAPAEVPRIGVDSRMSALLRRWWVAAALSLLVVLSFALKPGWFTGLRRQPRPELVWLSRPGGALIAA